MFVQHRVREFSKRTPDAAGVALALSGSFDCGFTLPLCGIAQPPLRACPEVSAEGMTGRINVGHHQHPRFAWQRFAQDLACGHSPLSRQNRARRGPRAPASHPATRNPRVSGTAAWLTPAKRLKVTISYLPMFNKSTR
jgi:hypothetical protein